MGRAALCMRAAALLAAAGMFIFLAEGISADNDIAEAVTARVLKPTQAIADVPEEYDELFEIQWGGGSLYHLKARLATMGCMLNTIWIYDDNQWHRYNQYNVPHSFNQPFLTQFSGGIPAATLYGDCIDICTFNEFRGEVVEGRKCTTFEEERQRGSITDYGTILNLPIEQDTPCDDGFDSRVKQHIFPLLPILSNTCIVRQATENPINIRGRIGLGNDNTLFFVLVWSNVSRFKSEEAMRALRKNALHIEIHELCHIQQEYYVVQQFIPYRYNSFLGSDWYSTEAYKKFQNLTGFQEIQTERYLDFHCQIIVYSKKYTQQTQKNFPLNSALYIY